MGDHAFPLTDFSSSTLPDLNAAEKETCGVFVAYTAGGNLSYVVTQSCVYAFQVFRERAL